MRGFMLETKLKNYIANLPIDSSPHDILEGFDPAINMGNAANVVNIVDGINIDNLPDSIITGSNLLGFSNSTTQTLRSSVALCLLAAQRVASTDTVIQSPDQWIDRHNTVLKNLGWVIEDGGRIESTFDAIDSTIHEAIIPFLTTAMGGAIAASSLIIKALEQLNEMDKDSPWFTLFDTKSQRFDVSEFQFTSVDIAEENVQLRMAAARFDAAFGRTQVLFFKLDQDSAKFIMSNSTMRTNTSSLELINNALKNKMNTLIKDYITALNL